MIDCKFCSVLVAPDLAVALPNLILQTDTVVTVLNRRPVAPDHVTLIVKAHRPKTSGFVEADLAGLATLAGRLGVGLERRFRPTRVILLGDGKPGAHLNLHLIPEPAGTPVSLADAVADLNQAARPATLTGTDLASLLPELRGA